MISYLIGAVLTFILCKIFRGKTHNQKYDQWFTFGLTILSWAGFAILMAIAIYVLIKKDDE